MINAEFFRTNDCFCGFAVSGHAGYANAGKDIVCASVTSAVMLTCNLITDYFGIEAQIDTEKNLIGLKLKDCGNDNAQRLIKALCEHLQMISEEFKGTIKITFSEV